MKRLNTFEKFIGTERMARAVGELKPGDLLDFLYILSNRTRARSNRLHEQGNLEEAANLLQVTEAIEDCTREISRVHLGDDS